MPQNAFWEGAMKFPHRRQFLHLAVGAATLPTVSRIARAQAYPTRPMRIVVGFPPGGSNDTLARPMGQWLSQRLGRPFIVENRAGAGGNLAPAAVVHGFGPASSFRAVLLLAISAAGLTSGH
jgi:tripartite-type tricarboxylate transporter receptor subunit TctC